MTKPVLFLGERDAMRAERRRQAVQAVQAVGERLALHARERDGRYLLYGR